MKKAREVEQSIPGSLTSLCRCIRTAHYGLYVKHFIRCFERLPLRLFGDRPDSHYPRRRYFLARQYVLPARYRTRAEQVEEKNAKTNAADVPRQFHVT